MDFKSFIAQTVEDILYLIIKKPKLKNEKEDIINTLESIVYAGLGMSKREFPKLCEGKMNSNHLGYYPNAIRFIFGIQNIGMATRFGEKIKGAVGNEYVDVFYDEVTIYNKTSRTNLFYNCYLLKQEILDNKTYNKFSDALLIRHHPMLITILNTLNEIDEYSIDDNDLINECIDLLSTFLKDVALEIKEQEEIASWDKNAITNSLKGRLAFEREIIELRKSRMEETEGAL